MNIIINKEEHLFLQSQVLQSIKIGSHLYGTNNENSDIDFLCIYKTSEVELHSGLPNFHQFQYKDIENNIDWNYCSELQFWKNLQSGDATINADIVLFTDLYTNKLEICRTYKVIKAYLGFAKRDLKDIKKDTKRKLIHAARGLYCAESLINNKLPTKLDIQNIYTQLLDKDDLITKEKNLRIKTNDLYDSNQLDNYYIEKCDNTLWQKLLESNNTKEFRY
jgi:predicted nucleotidyltransferase